MTNIILNPQFDIAVPSEEPGEAESWLRDAYQKYPGFAAFRQPFGWMTAAERFQFADSPARVVGSAIEPFALPVAPQWSFAISLVAVAPTNVIRVNGVDLRSALPPGTSCHIVGIPPDTQLDGYWTVASVELAGSDSRIHVLEDVLVVPPPGAVINIPPVLACTPHEHAWQAGVIDTTAYPVMALGAGQTIEVRIDRLAPQTIPFIGGETTAVDVAEVIDELLMGGGAHVIDGQVEVFSEERGPDAFVQVLPVTAALVFAVEENRGYGQWAQMWALYMTAPAAATTPEIAEILTAHWRHVRVSYPGGAAGDPVHVQTERKGVSARLFIDDTLGGIHDSAAWPIAARTPGVDDNLRFTAGAVAFSVTLAVTDVTPELVSLAIANSIAINGADAVASYSMDRVYIDSRINLNCGGGSANADLGFPTTVTTYGGGTAARTIGLEAATDTGVDDVGWFDDFDSITSVYLIFAEGSPASATYETFTWADVFPTMDSTTSVEASFESWYGSLVADPTKWPAAEDTFDEAWDNEWLSSYVATVPQAGAWKPPGISPLAAIVGNELTFPLTLRANGNRLAIYSETDAAWYVLSLTGAIYTDITTLVAHLNAKLAATGITDDIEFGNIGNTVTLGWDASAGGVGAIHLAAPAGILANLDARETLGLHPLPADFGAASVNVPVGYYDGTPMASWDENQQYGVDPWARLVFTTSQDPDTSAWLAESNGDELALFNTLKPAITNTYAEQFSLGAWYGAYVPPGSYTGWTPATFDSALVPEDYEDFEEGW